MSVVSFRVDKRLKERMEALRHINWSELLRAFLEKVVSEEEAKMMKSRKDLNRVTRASMVIDELRLKSKVAWSGAEEVKRWRKLRYSYLTHQ